MKRSIIIMAVLAAVSCTPSGTSPHRAIPYVNEILSGTVPGLSSLNDRNLPDRRRGIYVVGDSASCACLRDTMLSFDNFDNASGALRSDLLPDFAGERISCLFSVDSCRYGYFMASGDTSGLRELAVNMLLCALDSTARMSLYDRNGLGRKAPAKMLIFTEPWIPLYGRYDIDTLLSATSCPVSVLVPVQCAFDDVLSGRLKAPSIAVVSDSDSSVFPVYEQLYRKMCDDKSLAGGSCVVFDAGDGKMSLRSFLEGYMTSEKAGPLNAVVFDCSRAGAYDFELERSRMVSVMHEEYTLFSHLFAPDFRFVSSFDCVIARCHSIMRERNVFSHDICLPSSASYWLSGDPDGKSSLSAVECIR